MSRTAGQDGGAPKGRLDPLGRAARALEHWYDPFRAERPPVPPRTLGAFFLWAYRGIGWPIGALAFGSLAMGFVEVAIMAGVGELVDRARASAPETFFETHGGFLLGLGALILLARPLALTMTGFFGSMIVSPGLSPSITWRLHRHVLGQPMRFFDDDFAGRIAQKELQASQAVDLVTIDTTNGVGALISFLIGSTAVLAAADWRLGLFAVLWSVLYFALLRFTLPMVRRTSRRRAEARASATGQIVDSVANIKTVKLFARPGEEEETAKAALTRYRRAAMEFGGGVTLLRALLNILNGVAMAGLIGAALLLWTGGVATIGAVATAAMLTFRLTHMSGWVAFMFLGIFREIGTIEDALGTLAKPHALRDPDAPQPAPMIAPNRAAGAPERIAFDDVSFHYDAATPDGEAIAAVQNVSLIAEPGEKIGLVGPSGAGKSTLAALLLRLYDVTSGRIMLGETDVRRLRQADLRARIGVVTQEAALFNRSALDNILYGREGADAEDAIAAAKRAQADGFIRALKDAKGREGYEAHLGERGVKLSGGQRQRIALARAFVKDAPILLLDEATSALDSESEAAILDAMSELMTNKTVIAIAHRLSTLAAMDRIIVLDQGRIIEVGRQEALIAANGLYAALWRRQSGGFIAAELGAETRRDAQSAAE